MNSTGHASTIWQPSSLCSHGARALVSGRSVAAALPSLGFEPQSSARVRVALVEHARHHVLLELPPRRALHHGECDAHATPGGAEGNILKSGASRGGRLRPRQASTLLKRRSGGA